MSIEEDRNEFINITEQIDFENDPDIIFDFFKGSLIEGILSVMGDKKITVKDLAIKTNYAESLILELLSEKKELTLYDVSCILDALNCKISVDSRDYRN